MPDLTKLLARDLKIAAELALAGVIVAVEATMLFGVFHYVVS